MVLTLILAAACTFCGLMTVHGLWAMSRTPDGWKAETGLWPGPAFFGLVLAVLLTASGVLGLLAGSVLAAVPLLLTVRITAQPWRSAAKADGWLKATFLVAVRLSGRIREAVHAARLDLLGLAGGLRRGGKGTPAAAADGEGPVLARPRRMPSTARLDPVVGPAPVPSVVAAELEAAHVAVPACWAAVAEWEASFEPEDEDDWRNHIAERAAGILTVGEAVGQQAEDHAVSVKFDPAVTEAHTAFADDFADTASAAARVLQVYDASTAAIQEHVDNGGTLVNNAREWHDAGGAEGGQAA